MPKLRSNAQIRDATDTKLLEILQIRSETENNAIGNVTQI
jgi:hypothetical protein